MIYKKHGDDWETEEDRILRKEKAEAARQSMSVPWEVRRKDHIDGDISYEIWTAHKLWHRILTIDEEDNPAAKDAANHIVTIHNASLNGWIEK